MESSPALKSTNNQNPATFDPGYFAYHSQSMIRMQSTEENGVDIDVPAGESLSQIHGEPSFALSTKDVELFLTRRAGHMGPVRFRVGKRWVQPYALAPLAAA
jgi:hypothetical protein